MNEKCCPKTIFDLRNCNFYIPPYQRGYRWTKQQIEELLDDVWEFANKQGTGNSFYCLQPIIVKEFVKDDGTKVWEVIDGQQRLTTLHIILSFFNSMRIEHEEWFTIAYGTREGSAEFLRNINEEQAKEYIDYYHIFNALQYVKAWFNQTLNNDGRSKNTVFQILSAAISDSVKVIWYEVDAGTDSSEVFTRVNMGKIPLTNAELIKALLLNESNFTQNSEIILIRRLEIAGEWDRIEYALQNEDFWYFLTNEIPNISRFNCRIDYIFKLMAREKNIEYGIKIVEEDLLPFHVFSRWFEKISNPGVALDTIWQEIKRYFLTFEEWYQDKSLYHYIGYLITIGKDIYELRQASFGKSKVEFNNYLVGLVKESINFRSRPSRINQVLEDLDYLNDIDRPYIKNILLLLNVITIKDNAEKSARFPFKSYKLEKWNLEHIHAVKSQIPDREHEKRQWIESAIAELPDLSEGLMDECKKILHTGNASAYDEAISKILNYFAENSEHEDINTISNLALLDAETNISYGNSVFLIKRKKILKRDTEGVFIPQCTKNVFLKYYNSDVEQLSRWGKKDRECYISHMKATLVDYLPLEDKR